jgi:hypothetical protein
MTQLQQSALAKMLLHLVAAHFAPVCTARGRRDDLWLALHLGQFVELQLDALLLSVPLMRLPCTTIAAVLGV